MAGFAAVGVASTVAYILLYLALRGALPAQWANALSLLITAVANTAANRRFTFGIGGRPQAGPQAAGLRHRAAAGLGRAGLAACRDRAARPRPGGHRARRGQPAGHADQIRAVPELGVPRRPERKSP